MGAFRGNSTLVPTTGPSDEGYTIQELYSYICEVMQIKSVTPMIQNHIRIFHDEDKMTYKEIMLCVKWRQEVADPKSDPKEIKWPVQYGLKNILNIREVALKYYKKEAQKELDRQRLNNERRQSVHNGYQGNNIKVNSNILNQRKSFFGPKFDYDDIDFGDDNIEIANDAERMGLNEK